MEENIICRLCLNVVSTGYTVLKENIKNTIKVLTSIDVSVDDNLPKLSCAKCIFNLYFIESVRSTIINSNEKLRSVVNRDGNFNELLLSKQVMPLELEPENCFSGDDVNFHNVEVKEEKFNPTNVIVDISSDIPDSITTSSLGDSRCNSNEDVSEKASTEDASDESDIKDIIYRKNNIKPYLYHCNVCNVDFRGHKLRMKHKRQHVKKTCEICGVSTRLDNFSKHMTKHKLGQQICDICGSIHKSFEGLRSHLFHFHNAKKKPYRCEECGATFNYSHRLITHKTKIHAGVRPYQCENCEKRFFDLRTMKGHVKSVHLKQRNYHCKYCKKDFSSGHALKVHIRQHTEETPYVCEICYEGFRQLVSLKTHMAKHKSSSTGNNQVEPHEADDEEEQVKADNDIINE